MLIKKLLITLLCLVLFNIVYGQSNVFNQNYNNTVNIFTNPANGTQYYNNESFRTLFENHLSFIGLGRSTNNRVLFPNFIDNDSTFLFAAKVYNNSSNIIFASNNFYTEGYSGGVSISENKSILVGTVNSSITQNSDSTKGIIAKMNSEEISINETLSLGKNTGLRGVEKLNDFNYIYGFVLREDTFDYNLLILKYNNELNLIDSSRFYLHYFNGLSHISFSEANDIYISGLQWENGIIVEGIYLAKLNSNLEVIWSKKFDRGTNRIFVPNKSTHTFQKNNFYLVGNTILSGGGPFPAVEGGLLIKTDSVGNELWQKTYNRGNPDYSEFFKGIKAHPDGTLIVAGGTRDYSTNPPSAPRGWLMKLDTAGNKIWERVISRYNEFNWDDYVNDLILTSDGGIALAGYLIHNFIQDENGIFHRNDAWLVKTDSCGYTVGDIPEPLIYVGQNIDGLSIQLHNLSEKYCSGTITWGDNTEDHVYAYSEPIYGYNSTLLTHTYTQPGTYEICLEALAGEEYRTYCTEVVLEPNSLASASLSQREVKIFPNPTNNYFILELPLTSTSLSQQNENLMAERSRSQIQIYNLTGQLVHQFPIKNQPQQKIDISHLADGVYIIRIENGQYTANKKLVVAR